MNRYLTDAEKHRELACFADTVAKWRSEGSPTRGGMGYPDPDIFATCDYLNALPGVCTLQSCTGHRLADDYRMPGQLWMRLSEVRARVWYADVAPALGQHPLMESVRTMHHDDGREIVDICFQGHEQEPSRLTESLAVVIAAIERTGVAA